MAIKLCRDGDSSRSQLIPIWLASRKDVKEDYWLDLILDWLRKTVMRVFRGDQLLPVFPQVCTSKNTMTDQRGKHVPFWCRASTPLPRKGQHHCGIIIYFHAYCKVFFMSHVALICFNSSSPSCFQLTTYFMPGIPVKLQLQHTSGGSYRDVGVGAPLRWKSCLTTLAYTAVTNDHWFWVLAAVRNYPFCAGAMFNPHCVYLSAPSQTFLYCAYLVTVE